MNQPRGFWAVLLAIAIVLEAAACTRSRSDRATSAQQSDSPFAAVQSRGETVMGVDQYTSTHVFEDLPDGGRIILDRDPQADTGGIARIRQHMHDITDAFEAGDFTKPFQVHAEAVPGTSVMAARRSTIKYAEVDRPRGAEVRIRTTDPAAVAAVHEFLAFQRGAHHASGHEGKTGRACTGRASLPLPERDSACIISARARIAPGVEHPREGALP